MAESEQEEGIGERFRLGRALKTTARDVLLQLYKQRFAQHNAPGATPFDMMERTSKGRFAMKMNKDMRKNIQANKVEKFDVTTLWNLLKNTCDLKKSDGAWIDTTKLEGNIEIVHQLRNEDAHWTQPGCSNEDLSEDWTKLTSALTNILQLAGLQDQLPGVLQRLRKIREGDAPPERIQEQIREKLVKLYRRGEKTALKPLVWSGSKFSYHHQVLETYTPIRITIANQRMEEEVKAADVVDRGRSGIRRVVVLEGETGTGKTSLLRYYAASWATNTPSPIPAVARLEYVLLLDLTAATQGTFSAKDVIQELLQEIFSNYHSTDIFNELARAGDKVLFMIDAYDERYKTFTDAFKTLLNKFPKASFLVATRPHCTQLIVKVCEEPASILTTHGFSGKDAMEYAAKLLRICKKESDLQEFIKVMSPYKEFLANPQLLCWSCWFWIEKGKQHFTTRGKMFTSLTDFLLRKLCHIRGIRILYGELPSEGTSWLGHVAHLAFTQAQQERTSFLQTSPEIKMLETKAKQLQLPPHEALSTLMQCDSSMTGSGERLVFQFVHESHACYLAAYHLVCSLQHNNRNRLISLLERVKKERQKHIILFLVSLLYNETKSVADQVVKDVVTLAQQFVSFYDITYYLDLVEESGHNPHLSRMLAKSIPGQPTEVPPLPLQHTTSYKQPLSGQLWLRPKELRREGALLLLLKQVQPARVWLRLCEGPHNDYLNPVAGHQAVEGDPEAALKLLTTVYHGSILPDLIVSDCTLTTSLDWPCSLWWLSLERCRIESQISIPRDLLKLKLSKCKNIDNLNLSGCDQIKALDIDSCSFIRMPQLPQCLQSLTISNCDQVHLLSLPCTLKHLTVRSHILPTLPQGLTKLHIAMPNLILDDILVHLPCDDLVREIGEAAQTLPVLQHLKIANVVLSPAAFLELLIEVQESCPRCCLQLESHCSLSDDDESWREIISTAINFSILPSITVIFKDETISHKLNLEDLLIF